MYHLPATALFRDIVNLLACFFFCLMIRADIADLCGLAPPPTGGVRDFAEPPLSYTSTWEMKITDGPTSLRPITVAQ